MTDNPEKRSQRVKNVPAWPTFLQDPRIHAMDGECVCGARSCPQCGVSGRCISDSENWAEGDARRARPRTHFDLRAAVADISNRFSKTLKYLASGTQEKSKEPGT
jgi:hypothetical protein